MSHTSQEPAGLPVSATMAQLRRRKLEATQALLGDTIAISDRAWQEASLLPGWTRAHVATHLARNADGFRRVVNGLLTHLPTRMYPGEAERLAELEEGSLRGALDLQIDLDTSAGLLNDAFNYLEESGATDEVEITAGFFLPVQYLHVARLSEVVLHHIDLDCGFTAQDVEPDLARWLLEWTCLRIGDRADFPLLDVSSASGFQARVGGWGEPHEVRGTDAALLGWLTRRGPAEAVAGAEGLVLPEL